MIDPPLVTALRLSSAGGQRGRHGGATAPAGGRAGVGSATPHRHFPSRASLLRAVFRDRVDAPCARAEEHTLASEPRTALFSWLRDFNAYAAASRGLVASPLHDGRAAGLLEEDDDGTQAARLLDIALDGMRLPPCGHPTPNP
ncbi:TetR/AcrR family transcriptional regulator [Streptomyces sp. NPDC101455]|uniref:TetR/AcrR family transcriptional regulator n=1 Tax=Streptomyces sp. NPDC101455 TaxID=3366142 RepID=UPI00381A6DE7